MRNKKVFKLFMVISLVLILTSISLACGPVEEQPEIVAEILLPWQSWVTIDGVVQDIVMLSDNYDQDVVITRQWATLNETIELNDLTWNETEEIEWMGSDEEPVWLEPGSSVTLNISTTVGDAAVVVQYTVAIATAPAEIVVHVINEAIVQGAGGNATIIGSLSNFDVHNDTGGEVDNLELELYGDITAEDINVWYPGWGTPASVTTLIPAGIEIMWKDVDNPIPHCQTKHFGVHFNGDVGQLVARAFWTKTS